MERVDGKAAGDQGPARESTWAGWECADAIPNAAGGESGSRISQVHF